jgi:hypothetical protein
MLRSRGLSLWDPPTKQGKLNYSRDAGHKLSTSIGSLCKKSAVPAAEMSLMINCQPCVTHTRIFNRCSGKCENICLVNQARPEANKFSCNPNKKYWVLL